MKRIVTLVLVLAVSFGGFGVFGQSIYKSKTPTPNQFIAVDVSDKGITDILLKDVFPKASHNNGGLRFSAPDTFSLVPVKDFERLADWYWGNNPDQSIEDAVVGLIGLASSLAPWSRVPVGFAVRSDKYPYPYMYVVFVTKECGQLVVYRLYPTPTGETICEKVSKDCLVRLVVLF